MKHKRLFYLLAVPTVIMSLPLVAMQFTHEVNWSPADFAIAWSLMAGVGMAYHLATSRERNFLYRMAMGLALVTAFVLVWVNLAVGIIGNEDHPANRMYFGVLVIGCLGAGLARLKPLGMFHALLLTAEAQFFVPIIALSIWKPEITLGVLMVIGFNTVFALLFAGSALLFRRSVDDRTQKDAANGEPGAS